MGAGWSQSDEVPALGRHAHRQVTTTWRDVVDQTTTGHEYLRRTLGSLCDRCVKYGWQIDMFAGYSGVLSACACDTQG